MMIPSYRQFVLHNKGCYADNRRMIEGVFKNSKTGKIIKGDNFSCIVVGTAEESYKMAIEYYNHTRSDPDDAERIFVSAKWSRKKGDKHEM